MSRSNCFPTFGVAVSIVLSIRLVTLDGQAVLTMGYDAPSGQLILTSLPTSTQSAFGYASTAELTEDEE